MKWSIRTIELTGKQSEGTETIELPEGAAPLELHATVLYYMQPEPGHMGMCQVIGCTEEAVVPRKFERFVVKVCSKHGEEYAPMKEG